MEKFLIDRDEVLKLIGDTYFDIYRDKEMVTDEEFAVLDFAKKVADKIEALDVQKIEGIDLGKGDGRVFPVDNRKIKEEERIEEFYKQHRGEIW